jgi:hypothetical protein
MRFQDIQTNSLTKPPGRYLNGRAERRRFRFQKPLMGPFVIMKGIADGLARNKLLPDAPIQRRERDFLPLTSSNYLVAAQSMDSKSLGGLTPKPCASFTMLSRLTFLSPRSTPPT